MDLHFLVMHLRKIRFEVHLIQDKGQCLSEHEMDLPVIDGVAVHDGVIEGLLPQQLERSHSHSHHLESLVFHKRLEGHSQLPRLGLLTGRVNGVRDFVVCQELLVEIFFSEFETQVVFEVVLAVFEFEGGEGELVDEIPHCLLRPLSELADLLQKHQLLLEEGTLGESIQQFSVVEMEEKFIRFIYPPLRLLPLRQLLFLL